MVIKMYEHVINHKNPSGRTWLSFISESNIAAKTSEAAASTAYSSKRWCMMAHINPYIILYNNIYMYMIIYVYIYLFILTEHYLTNLTCILSDSLFVYLFGVSR